jgi:hypothetical protein
MPHKLIIENLAHPPRALRKATLDNIALVPASLLPASMRIVDPKQLGRGSSAEAPACTVWVETGESRTPRPERVDRRSTPGVVDVLIPRRLGPRRPGPVRPAGLVLGASHTGGRARSTSTKWRPLPLRRGGNGVNGYRLRGSSSCVFASYWLALV